MEKRSIIPPLLQDLILALVFCLVISAPKIHSQTMNWDYFTNNGTSSIHKLNDTLYGLSYGIIKSIDSGKTWTQAFTSYSFQFLTIDKTGNFYVVDENQTYNDRIIKSTDKGLTWKEILPYSSFTQFIEVDSLNSVWAGVGKTLYHSTNGGLSWDTKTFSTACRAIAFHGSRAILNTDYLYLSSDYGNNWSVIMTNQEFRAIRFDRNGSIYCARDYYYTPGILIRSSNSGISWDTLLNSNTYGLYFHGDSIYAVTGSPYTSGDLYISTISDTSWKFCGSFYDGVTSMEFIDPYIIVGSTHGYYRNIPDSLRLPVGSFFPLAIGNSWQYKLNVWGFADEVVMTQVVSGDTIINSKKYYNLSSSSDLLYPGYWLRYDDSLKVLYVRYKDSDYVNMNFKLNLSDQFSGFSFLEGVRDNFYVTNKHRISVFDTTLYLMSSYTSYPYSQACGENYVENIGHLGFSFMNQNGSYSYNLVRALIHDSKGNHYYSDKQKPTISFPPITEAPYLTVNFDCLVNHPYEDDQLTNFIDSVSIYSYYSNGNNIIGNPVIRAVHLSSLHGYYFNFKLDSVLVNKGYDLYYKIVAKDRGVVPEYGFSPDTGYYRMIYNPLYNSGWNILPTALNSKLKYVSFVSESVGFVASECFGGDSLTLLSTTNGGYNWQSNSIKGLVEVNDFLMVDNNIGFLAGKGMVNQAYAGKLIFTKDGALNWPWIYNSTSADFTYEHLFSLNSKRVWFGTQGAFFSSGDGGLTWTRFNQPNQQMFWGFIFVDSLIGFAYDQMKFKKTTDGGETWNYFPYTLPEISSGLGFLNSNVGFISGTNGYIAKTTDGGLSWVTKSSGTTVNLKSISVVDSLNTYICGDNGTILRTTDGGEYWRKEQTGTVANLNQIKFYKNKIGFAVGEDGVVLKTYLIFTDIKKDKLINFSFDLLQNYPNPFNPSTKINWQLPVGSQSTLKVYDILGREVATLVNEYKQAGKYETEFNAEALPSGVYFYRLQAGSLVETKKMILLK